MIRVFYHSADLDGHCSGAIVKYRFPEAVMHPINYGQEFPWQEIQPEDEVYMVDFCLQPFEGMYALQDRCASLVWIDHHSSAINSMFEMRSTLGGNWWIVGVRDTTKAACELTWEYLFPDKPVPLAVKLLSLYDSWTYQGHELEEMVLPFQVRLRMEDLDPRKWHEGYPIPEQTEWEWRRLFEDPEAFPGGIWQAEAIVDDYVKAGRLLLQYDEIQKAKYAKTYAFETMLVVKCNSRVSGTDIIVPQKINLKAIAVNLGHTNSKVFDSVWKKECRYCDFGMVNALDGKQLDCAVCFGKGYLLSIKE